MAEPSGTDSATSIMNCQQDPLIKTNCDSREKKYCHTTMTHGDAYTVQGDKGLSRRDATKK